MTDMVERVDTPVHLSYSFVAGFSQQRWLEGLKDGKLLGMRCPECNNVYFPPLGLCALDGASLAGEVPLSGKATVTSFTTVNVPFFGQQMEIPYVLAFILLDGADEVFLYPLLELAVEDVRIGMRVEAQWVSESQHDFTLANIIGFRPIDEPDVELDEVKAYQ